jgi:hypothetical protein
MIQELSGYTKISQSVETLPTEISTDVENHCEQLEIIDPY